jgi:multiple sugar transport system permease protein
MSGLAVRPNLAGSMPLPAPRAASSSRRRQVLTAYVLLAPALLLVPGLLAYPILWEVWSSLTNRAVQNSFAAYVGLSNYLHLLDDPMVRLAAQNTMGYIGITAALKLVVGIAIALALARPFRGRWLIFLATFLPWAYPAGVALIGWSRFMIPPVHTAYSPWMADLGLFFDTRLGSGTWGFLSIVAFNVWRGGSFTGIFLLAALNGIPQGLSDYAALEVKGGWRMFWMVTVPLLRPFLALAAILSFTTAVADLGNVWLQTGHRDVYPIIWTLSFQYAINAGQWGKAAALSLIILPILAVTLLACYRVIEPLEDGAA